MIIKRKSLDGLKSDAELSGLYDQLDQAYIVINHSLRHLMSAPQSDDTCNAHIAAAIEKLKTQQHQVEVDYEKT